MRMAEVINIKTKLEAGGQGSGRTPGFGKGPQAKSESVLRRHGYEQVGGVPSKAIGNQYRSWGTQPSHGDSNWRHPDGHSATVNRGGWVTHDPGPKGRTAGFNLAVRGSDKIGGYLRKMHASSVEAGGPGSGRHPEGMHPALQPAHNLAMKHGFTNLVEHSNIRSPYDRAGTTRGKASYKNPDTGRSLKVATTGKNHETFAWDTGKSAGTGYQSLSNHLSGMKAGGPGSGRKPTGTQMRLHNLLSKVGYGLTKTKGMTMHYEHADGQTAWTRPDGTFEHTSNRDGGFATERGNGTRELTSRLMDEHGIKAGKDKVNMAKYQDAAKAAKSASQDAWEETQHAQKHDDEEMPDSPYDPEQMDKQQPNPDVKDQDEDDDEDEKEEEQETPHLDAKMAHDDAAYAHSVAKSLSPTKALEEFHDTKVREHHRQSNFHSTKMSSMSSEGTNPPLTNREGRIGTTQQQGYLGRPQPENR